MIIYDINSPKKVRKTVIRPKRKPTVFQRSKTSFNIFQKIFAVTMKILFYNNETSRFASQLFAKNTIILLLFLAFSSIWMGTAQQADTVFTSDTFTDTDTTLLENHVPDVGTSWTKGPGSGTGALTINSNTIYSALSAAAVRFWYIGATSASADYDVQATFYKPVSGATTPMIIGRASTSAVTAYGARCGSSNWTIYKWVAGTASTLGTYSSGSACTTAQVGRLRMRGDQISFYVDDVLRIGPITDSSISAAGRAGVATYYADASTSRYLDDWSALDDTTAPTYSAVASSTTSVSATITWTTDEPGTSQVDYGLTGSYGSNSTLSTTSTTTHSVSLSSLSSNTVYNFRVATVDGSGNVASSTNYTLLTAPTDSTPPVRSAGSPSGTLAAGTTSATLSLTTDEIATCKYGTVAGTAYASIANTFSTTGGTSHSQSLTGLTVGSYTYYVRCQDEVPNPNTDDYSISFTIPADTTAPSVPTNLTATATTTSQIGLSWTASTDDVAVTGYSIYRGGVGLASTTATTYYNTGLTPSTLYSYTISAYDAAGNDSGQTGAATATTNATTTYYISPSGSDSANGLTTGTTWLTFSKAFSTMFAADELVLLDGTYSEAAGTGYISYLGTNSAQPPSGISTSYMTYVHAQNPGNVTITGGLFVGRSTRKDSYIKIQGITFQGTSQLYNTSYITIEDTGFHDVSEGGGAVFTVGTNEHENGNTYNLIEDVWVWGSDRLIVSNYRADNNVWRRVVIRGDGCDSASCTGSGNPNVGMTVYDSANVSVQNVIILDRILGGGTAYGNFASAQHTASGHFLGPNEWLGSISLGAPDTGFHFEADYSNDSTYSIKNSVSWGSNSTGLNIDNPSWTTDKVRNIEVSNFTSGSNGGTTADGIRVGPNVTNSGTLRNLVSYNSGRYGINSVVQPSYGDVFGSVTSAYNQTTCASGCLTSNPIQNGSILYPTRIENGSALKGTGFGGADYGANIIYRYGTDGARYGDADYNTLSGTALWPWPNEDRIKTEMAADDARGFAAAGNGLYGGAVTLTSYIWEYLGNACPEGICSAVAPTLTTQAATSLAATTATLNGNITATGGASATVRGFAWGTISSLSGGNTATTTNSGSYGTGAFTGSLSTLSPNTIYYFRPYATNSAGTGYGSIETFTSSIAIPTITTQAATSLAQTTATLNGTITATGGASATARGFAYGTSSTLATTIATTTSSGSFSTGAYTGDISSLTCATTYYFRPYATNSAGTGLGTIETFDTTACSVPVSSPVSSGGGGGGSYGLSEYYPPSPKVKPPVEAPKASIIEFVEKVPKILKPWVPEFLKPESPETKSPEVPIEELVAKEASLAFQGKWQLLPTDPIREFVLAPLPKSIRNLAQKFPELEKTLEEVGVSKITDVAKLKTVKLTLPGLTERVGLPTAKVEPGKFALPQGVPVAKLSPAVKQQLPTEIVFAKTGGELIDFNIDLSVSDKGEPQQKIATISGKPLQLVVKPDKPVKSIKGYVVFKSKASQPTSLELPLNSLLASVIFANPVFAKTQDQPVRVEEKLVLLEFEYTDPDGDGIYTAEIQAPLVAGEYEIITVMDFDDPELGKKEIRLTTVIDPEGYVYERDGDKETRIPGAIISLFWLNPETKQYELWPAKEYQQENPQTTDVRGTYSFLVPEGYYYLKAETPGYLVYDGKPFQVKEGSGIHINIELKTKYWWLNIVDWKTILLVAVIILLLYNFYRDKIRERLARTKNI